MRASPTRDGGAPHAGASDGGRRFRPSFQPPRRSGSSGRSVVGARFPCSGHADRAKIVAWPHWPHRFGRTLKWRAGRRSRRLSAVPSSLRPSPPVADGCPGSCLTPRKAALAGPQAAFACTPIAASAPSTSRASLTLAVTSERSRAMNSRWSERSLASPACFWIQPTRHTGSRNVLPRN